MLKYPARHYDQQLRLRVSPMLWIALLYGVRHFFLLAASKLMPLESSQISWIALQAESILLWADLPALLVLLATGHRIPGALRVMRWVWLHGRSILLVSYVLSMAIFVGLHLNVLTAPDDLAASAIILLTDAAFIGFLARSALVKDIFSEFPEQAEEKPASRPVSSERALAEEVARNRQQALLTVAVLPDLPADVIALQPGDSVLPALEAAARCEALDRLGEAEAIYRAVLTANPACADAWHAFGLLAFQAGQRAHGFALVEEAMRLDGVSGMFRRNACEMARREGRFEEAIRYGELACRLSPEDADAWHYLGMALTNAKRFPAAIEAYRKVISLNPEHVLCWNNLGVALHLNKQIKEAEEAYRKVLSLSPEHAEAKINLEKLVALR